MALHSLVVLDNVFLPQNKSTISALSQNGFLAYFVNHCASLEAAEVEDHQLLGLRSHSQAFLGSSHCNITVTVALLWTIRYGTNVNIFRINNMLISTSL